MNQIEVNVHNYVHNFDIVPRLLGNKSLSNMLSIFRQFISKDSELFNIFSQITESSFIQNKSKYKPYGNFTYLKSKRGIDESDHVILKSTSYKEKKQS